MQGDTLSDAVITQGFEIHETRKLTKIEVLLKPHSSYVTFYTLDVAAADGAVLTQSGQVVLLPGPAGIPAYTAFVVPAVAVSPNVPYTFTLRQKSSAGGSVVINHGVYDKGGLSTSSSVYPDVALTFRVFAST